MCFHVKLEPLLYDDGYDDIRETRDSLTIYLKHLRISIPYERIWLSATMAYAARVE